MKMLEIVNLSLEHLFPLFLHFQTFANKYLYDMSVDDAWKSQKFYFVEF